MAFKTKHLKRMNLSLHKHDSINKTLRENSDLKQLLFVVTPLCGLSIWTRIKGLVLMFYTQNQKQIKILLF